MTCIPDPDSIATTAALENQLRQLSALVSRLERARRELLPGPRGSWKGGARGAYDAGIDALGMSIDAGLAALRSARDRTAAALNELAARV